MNKMPLSEYIPQFIYPFTYWRTSWLLAVLWIMNKIAINIPVQVLLRHKFSASLSKHRGEWLIAGSYDKSKFGLVRNCQKLSSKVAYYFAFSPAMHEIPVAPHPHQQLVFSVLHFGHCRRDGLELLHCCLNFHFLDDIWYGALFHVLICHLYIFFHEIPVKVFGPFLNQVVHFLIVEFWEFFICFG